MHLSRIALPLLGTAIIPATSCQRTLDGGKPNIIILLADDLGYGDLSCLNPGSRIQTPNFDRLAKQGMVFSNAHSPSAVSTPTRYGILTGRYCFRSSLKQGVLCGYDPDLIDSRVSTIADIAKSAGYRTGCIGKWHLGLNWPKINTGLPLISGNGCSDPDTRNVDYNVNIGGGPKDHGFDYSFVIPASLDMSPYCYIRDGRLAGPVTGKVQGSSGQRGIFWRSGDIQKDFDLKGTLERITSEALSFIREQSRQQSPFFLYLPLTSPHTPWLPSESFSNTSQAGTYGDFVIQTDNCAGRVMDLLAELKIDGNTIVFVTSDNGSNWTPDDITQWNHRANGSFRGQKSDIWEGGHHVPFLVQWKTKIKAGSRCDGLVCLTDFFATLMELTGAGRPSAGGEDSRSFLNLLTSPDGNPERTSVVTHSINGMYAIQTLEWKFVDGRGSGGWSDPGSKTDPPGQLYHLTFDPGETVNLFDNEPDKVKELQFLLDSTRQVPVKFAYQAP